MKTAEINNLLADTLQLQRYPGDFALIKREFLELGFD